MKTLGILTNMSDIQAVGYASGAGLNFPWPIWMLLMWYFALYDTVMTARKNNTSEESIFVQ